MRRGRGREGQRGTSRYRAAGRGDGECEYVEVGVAWRVRVGSVVYGERGGGEWSVRGRLHERGC